MTDPGSAWSPEAWISSLTMTERQWVLALQRVASENYADLLDQMDEAWGRAETISRAELNAFITSRTVHTPTDHLHRRIAELEAEVERLRKVIQRAFKMSRNRWAEWGERALAVADILEEARYPERIAEEPNGEQP